MRLTSVSILSLLNGFVSDILSSALPDATIGFILGLLSGFFYSLFGLLCVLQILKSLSFLKRRR